MRPTNEDGSPAVPMKLKLMAFPPDPRSPLGTILGKCYQGPGGLRVIANREHGDWHLSVSHPTRYPTWDELRDVAWALQPGLTFKLLVPAKGQPYTNFHGHCLHLFEEKLA